MARKTTFEWILEKLEDDDSILSTEIVSDLLLRINRKEGESISITKSTLSNINLNAIKAILTNQDADFILHTIREPFINGSVFEYLNRKQKIIGGFGDLFRVLRQNKNYPYLPPQVGFIMRGLEQHTKVSNVRRLDNKRYEIERYGLETVIIIALDDYDIGIESVRSAVNDFDKFDAVLKSNPNGSITSSAVTLADSRELKVFKWGQLLGILNRKWNWKK
ncbi:MAG: hypothetical protein V2I33_17005 [Kangiellaceae bacterium]|jgi:hypothetical protein|nr:hypothetical protein [Kangiellaceae bacterium]